MEHRSINKKYETIANELIETEPSLAYIKNSKVKITYLESDQTKKNGKNKWVLGECEKVAAKNKWAISSDFTITLFSNNLIGMSKEQIRIVLHHELLHVGIEPATDGEENYFINRHDIEDFNLIIDQYGMNWADGQQELFKEIV